MTLESQRTCSTTDERNTRQMEAKWAEHMGILRSDTTGDNSWSESFFANLKKGSVRWTHFQIRAEARQKIFAYTEAFYNTRRIQKRLDYISPLYNASNVGISTFKQVLLKNLSLKVMTCYIE